MSVRVTYLVIATVCIITFWYQTKAIPFSLLSLEQKFISILLIGVICLNSLFIPPPSLLLFIIILFIIKIDNKHKMIIIIIIMFDKEK